MPYNSREKILLKQFKKLTALLETQGTVTKEDMDKVRKVR